MSLTTEYEDVPGAAIFEATQRAIRALGLEPVSEDLTSLTIRAVQPGHPARIRIAITEIGPTTEQRVSLEDGEADDGQEGVVADRLFHETDAEVSRMWVDGRLRDSSTSGAGPDRGKEPSSGGKTLLKLALAAGAAWIFFTDSGQRFLDDLVSEFTVSMDVASYDCTDVGDLFEKETLQNAFGGEFTVITVTGLSLVSQDSDEIVCTGTMALSNGTSQLMQMSVRRNPEASGIIYGAEPV